MHELLQRSLRLGRTGQKLVELLAHDLRSQRVLRAGAARIERRDEGGRVMANQQPSTLGALRASGYEVLPVREEIRKNLIARLSSGT